MRKAVRKKINIVILFGSVILSMANVFLIKNFDAFGAPLFFAIGILVQLLLLIAVASSLVVVLRPVWKIIGSILLSAERGAAGNKYVKRYELMHKGFYKWLRDRVDHKSPWGLVLTLGTISTVVFLKWFLSVLHGLASQDTLHAIDTRIVNLLPSIRTNAQTEFFRFMTFWGNWQTIVALTVLLVVVLLLKRKQLAAYLLTAGLIIEELTVTILKNFVGRPRPDGAIGIIRTDTLSFPSGHVLAATVIYGLIAYLLFRTYKSHAARLSVVLAALIVVALIAMSRIYLGVHFLSDVQASFLLGGMILSLLITASEILSRFGILGRKEQELHNGWLKYIPIGLVFWAFILSPVFIKTVETDSRVHIAVVDHLDPQTLGLLPKYSETLTGSRMSPVSFIYVGSRGQIIKLFKDHGWYEADEPTLTNTLRAIALGVQDGSYPTAPMTPSYVNAKTQDLSFQLPTAQNSVRQRHHTRIWQANYSLPNGAHIWVGTASFDEGVKRISGGFIPTHRIDPHIDGERAYIISSLGIKDFQYVRVAEPQLGKNAGGDQFFTDGRAALIRLDK